MVGSSFFSESDLLDEINDVKEEVNTGKDQSKYARMTVEQVDHPSPTETNLTCRLSGTKSIVQVWLRDLWTDCEYLPGIVIHITPAPNSTTIVVDGRGEYAIVIEPDHLISITTVADAVSCLRKAVLTTRMQPSCSEPNDTTDKSGIHLAVGSIVHEIFEEAMRSNDLVDIGRYVQEAIQRNVLTIYACGIDEEKAYQHVVDMIRNLPKWLKLYMRDQPHGEAVIIDELKCKLPEASKSICLPNVYSLEESFVSHTYGLKGKIDAMVLLRFPLGTKQQMASLIAPFELKTGKVTNSTAHRAQTLLYTLQMADRYGLSVNYGLLFYLASGTFLRIVATPPELQALLMTRNRIAAATCRSDERLPRPISSAHQCQQCAQLSNCVIMLKLSNDDNDPALNETLQMKLFETNDTVESSFFRKWNTFLNLEETECRNASALCSGRFAKVVLEACAPDKSSSNSSFGRYLVRLRLTNVLQIDLNIGDPVSLRPLCSDEKVAIGFINELTDEIIIASCDRDISHTLIISSSGQWSQSLERVYVMGATFRICKDEMVMSFSVCRTNLVQLFNPRNQHLCKLVSKSMAPRFNNQKVCVIKKADLFLDPGQIKAIEHCLAAEDYGLVLGMPGTGKTTTLVALVKHLIESKQRILISSYTHSAVDNLLLKLLAIDVKVLRLGNTGRIDKRLAHVTISAENFSTVAALREAMHGTFVIGVTCLGAANNAMLISKLCFDLCIVDEASQITVPAILGPLLLAKKFILVGDHYQLPPLVRSSEAAALGLTKSLFQILAEDHPQAVTTLSAQYRMCADIQQLANTTVYGGRLQCANKAVATAHLVIDTTGFFCAACGDNITCWIRNTLDPAVRVVFLDTDGLAEKCWEQSTGQSVYNATESSIATALVCSMLNCGIKPEQICVISPFRSQVRLLSQQISMPDVEICTIDRYQGRDKDCVILSFVRANAHSNFGFLLRDWHRLNVAFTRARKKLVMLGSWSTIMPHEQMLVLGNLLIRNGWRYFLPSNALAHEPV